MTARVPAGYYLPDDADFVAPARKLKQRKARELEAPVHVAVLKYLRMALPGAVIHHSPNAINIKCDPKTKAIAQARNKAHGMLVGFPDLIVIWRGQIWGFEVKPASGVLSEAQATVGRMFEANGARWAVVRSVTDAEDAVREWRGCI